MPFMIVFAIAAAALMIPVMVSWMRQSDQTMLGTVAARQLYAVTQAAKGYITAYAGTIEATAAPTTPATITVPMLVATGFLPQGFGAVNPYQQGWVVEVLQPSPGDLQALALSTGGQPIPLRDAPRIGAEAGSAGGTVTSAGTAQGSYDGWTVSLTNYPNPGVGHLAALIDYSNGQLQNDYLYRTAVPGQPQLNTMQTSLGMGGNDINNANNVQANSAQLVGGNPNGMNGSLQIGSNFLYGDSSNMAVRTPGGFYIQNQNGSGAASINEVQNIVASGQVQVGDDVALGTAGGTAIVNNSCTPNGAMAANANGSGQLLACQDGTWQPLYTPSQPVNPWLALDGKTATYTYGFSGGWTETVSATVVNGVPQISWTTPLAYCPSSSGTWSLYGSIWKYVPRPRPMYICDSYTGIPQGGTGGYVKATLSGLEVSLVNFVNPYGYGTFPNPQFIPWS